MPRQLPQSVPFSRSPLDQLLRGANGGGALVERVILSKQDIGPGRACDACRKTGDCVQRDGVPALLEQMERSQVLVLGTPTYCWGPTLQSKAFVDGWHGAGHIVTFE